MWSAIRKRLFGEREAEPAVAAPSGPSHPPAKGPPSATLPGAAARQPNTPRPPPPAADESFTDGFFGKRIDDDTLADVLDDLEIVLLESDVALPVVEKLRRDLKRSLAGRKLRVGVDAEAAIRTSLEASVREILQRPKFDLAATARAHPNKPYIVLFVGVNGTGKTTTVAKLAHHLREAKLGVVIAAGDTFRAGAIEQLLVHGERLGIKVVRQGEGSDPAAVSFDAVAHAKARGLDVVLIDTAGRQHTNQNLIEEAKKIRRVVHPDLTLFVGDALSGNDVVEQAKMFQEALGVDGLVLNKLDADAKGGAALSATFVTGKPILYVGVGQGYGDLRRFDADWMVQRLFADGAAA